MFNKIVKEVVFMRKRCCALSFLSHQLTNFTNLRVDSASHFFFEPRIDGFSLICVLTMISTFLYQAINLHLGTQEGWLLNTILNIMRSMSTPRLAKFVNSWLKKKHSAKHSQHLKLSADRQVRV